MRRLLGPVGGPFLFCLIAALVFAGLGWVTVVSLRVEQAQREAAAQAELGNNLRVALWRLDGRMLPAMGVEDSRPFYHYSSADPLTGSTAGPTPLLAAPLPEWMKLHVQLDPVAGWDSPQVLSPEASERVSQAWPELPLGNNTTTRAAVLTSLRNKYPALGTCELFAARERATPLDDRPFAAPLVDPLPQSADNATQAALVPPADQTPKPPPPDAGRAPLGNTSLDKTSETFRLLGWELPRRDAVASNLRQDEGRGYVPQKDATLQQPAPPGQQVVPGAQAPVQQKLVPFPPNAPAGNSVGRGGNPPLTENERNWLAYRTRLNTIARGVQEAKNAGLEYPQFNRSQGMYQNSINPAGDGRSNPNTSQTQIPAVPTTGGPLPAPGGPPGGAPLAPVTPPPGRPGGPGGFGAPATIPPPAFGDKDGKDVKRGPAAGLVPPNEDVLARAKKGEEAKKRANDALKSLQREQLRGTLTEHLATLGLGLERRRCLDEIQQGTEDDRKRLAIAADDRSPAIAAAWAVAAAAVGGPRPVAPAEERPVPVFQNTFNGLTNNLLVGPPGVNIHLGSMRPQWITAPDGTETLVLVRAVKIDNKTVYQGVVLDWPKLQQLLKDEVKDLFPDAALVPVKDAAGVSPDRAMTALPVQLDPGPAAALPPTGWTPLRFGLVLAWVAALVAFAAVGLTGWSLLDLAERRIRFVSAVTHELRTPLTSLRLYLDLLMSGMIQDEAKKQEYLNTLAVESDRLHRLIDNVLDFAKLERRAKNGTLKPMKVGELLSQLQQTWTDRVGADGKELVVISTLPADLELSTDATMVYQIVGNLIDNARKYTRDAEDRRIWLWAKPGGSGRVVFEVEDRGAGVPQSERKAIFKPFRRGTQADAKAGGAGLGLALAKQWAEVLGGTVAYRPADGAPGSCFRLELPLK